MNNNRLFQLSALLILPLLILSCTSTPQGDNGIYYWRTTFKLSDSEKKFLADHNISKMYVHFFDVSCERSCENAIVPSATLIFKDSVTAGIEIVPTIYITNQAMGEMTLREEEYASKIVRRVNAMCRKHHVTFNELQLDCDWTKSTRKPFYRLCEMVKQLLDTTQTLSSTIRLHQLTQVPPPVDKGVLMVYNTGNAQDFSCENSIFSLKDIEPYLRDDRLSKYQLQLDVAYPVYGWNLLFHQGEDSAPRFDRIIKQPDITLHPNVKQKEQNLYEVTMSINKTDGTREKEWIDASSLIKVERPSVKEILKVKQLIDRQLKSKPHNTILYHLDETQLSNYSDNEISKIYRHN